MARTPKIYPPRERGTNFGTPEAHNAYYADQRTRWGWAEGRPCDCGYWAPSAHICHCMDDRERAQQRTTCQKRLAEHAKSVREQEARDRRRWPGKEPHPYAPKGHCKWCGKAIMRPDGVRLNLRKTRHDECLTQYLVRIQPASMRAFVFARDGGRCAECGFVHGADGQWEADHTLQLALADGDPDRWAPENVRILCVDPCHKNKTREDAAERAAHRQARKAEGTTT